LSEKNIRIILNDGKIIRIPNSVVNKIILPNILIRRSFFRLVLDIKNINKSLEKIKMLGGGK
jgi:hypothetical protein